MTMKTGYTFLLFVGLGSCVLLFSTLVIQKDPLHQPTRQHPQPLDHAHNHSLQVQVNSSHPPASQQPKPPNLAYNHSLQVQVNSSRPSTSQQPQTLDHAHNHSLRIQENSSHQATTLPTTQPPEPLGYNHNRTLMVTLIGGLGNHLWLYSTLYGIAKKTNRIPIACFGYDIRAIFSNLSVPIYNSTLCTKGKPLNPKSSLHVGQRNNHLYYDTEMISIIKESQNPHASICCYLQNLGFFIEYMEELKAQFVIKPSLQSSAQEYLRTLSKTVADRSNRTFGTNDKGQVLINGILPVFVNVHVRRGNMLGEKYVVQPEPPYFKNAMNYFRKKYGKSVIFSVATDDSKWCKANITGDDVYLTSSTGGKSRELEFAIAVACNHTVMSVGTYGWWMGFLTGGEVVYIKDWAKGPWKQWLLPGQFFPHKWKPM